MGENASKVLASECGDKPVRFDCVSVDNADYCIPIIVFNFL